MLPHVHPLRSQRRIHQAIRRDYGRDHRLPVLPHLDPHRFLRHGMAWHGMAYIAPDDSARIKAVTSPSISIPYHTFNFEPKLQAVREYRKSY